MHTAQRTEPWRPPQQALLPTNAPGTMRIPHLGQGRLHRCYLCFWSHEEVPLQGSSHHPHVLRAPDTTKTGQVSGVGRAAAEPSSRGQECCPPKPHMWPWAKIRAQAHGTWGYRAELGKTESLGSEEKVSLPPSSLRQGSEPCQESALAVSDSAHTLLSGRQGCGHGCRLRIA